MQSLTPVVDSTPGTLIHASYAARALRPSASATRLERTLARIASDSQERPERFLETARVREGGE